jgi:hypothetical protein
VDHVALLQLGQVGVGLELELLQAVELVEEPEDAVAAVVAAADGDAFGVEEDDERVEGGEAGGVGEGRTAEEGGEDCFVAGAGWGGVAGVDVGVGGGVGLRGVC